MVMDDTEIRNSYNQAKDKKEQVKVLADLNCVSPSEMRAHLVDLGLNPTPMRGGGRKDPPGTGAPASGLAALLGQLCQQFPDAKVRSSSGEISGVTLINRYRLSGEVEWTEIKLEAVSKGGGGK